MAKAGRAVKEVEIKCGVNLLRDIFRYIPTQVAFMAPNIVKRCDLLSGQWGASGSVINWHFILDGKVNTMKQIMEVVDDESHKMVLKVIEGDVMEVYNALTLIPRIESIGDKHVAIWTLNFEKENATIPDPTSFLDMLCAATKDMDAYIHNKNP